MTKIGIMGGTFNPIHYGHLFMAEQAYEQMELDKVLFMPSNNPPHKDNGVIISNEHRSTMVELAINGNPHFGLSTMEMDRKGITYTADTLRMLNAEQLNTEYYFIIGADSFFNLNKWREPENIFKLCTLLVFERDLVDKDKMVNHYRYLSSIYPYIKLEFLSMPTIQISSNNIRQRINDNNTIRYYVPDKVLAYIIEHKLYTNVEKKKE